MMCQRGNSGFWRYFGRERLTKWQKGGVDGLHGWYISFGVTRTRPMLDGFLRAHTQKYASERIYTNPAWGGPIERRERGKKEEITKNTG